MDHLVEALTEEVNNLKLKVALTFMDASEEDKALAEQIFKEQQDEIAVLSVELQAVKQSRDQYQAENARLKKYVASLEKQVKGKP